MKSDTLFQEVRLALVKYRDKNHRAAAALSLNKEAFLALMPTEQRDFLKLTDDGWELDGVKTVERAGQSAQFVVHETLKTLEAPEDPR